MFKKSFILCYRVLKTMHKHDYIVESIKNVL